MFDFSVFVVKEMHTYNICLKYNKNINSTKT